MSRLRIPNNWEPRSYQLKAWNYWVRDSGNHIELIWHRRSGKDDIALHGTAVKAHERVANYWHMLPRANQVRKAIWTAVNPHTGKKRIDEAFPQEIRAKTNDSEMIITFRNGSTWQCLGSDNYQGAIGSTPAGIVYSEWSQANPSSRGYLRPILAENNGWQAYITTPRGKNHAYKTYRSAEKSPNSFAQILTADSTNVFTDEFLKEELQEYIDTYGENMGKSLFEQEYYCSFDAAILGAVWGAELTKLETEGRYTECQHDPDYKVYTAWDIGRADATAIWFYQVIANEIRIIDFCQGTLKDPDYFASQLIGREVTINIINDEVVIEYGKYIDDIKHRLAYDYETHWLPHDAFAKTFAAKGKSVQELLSKVLGYANIRKVPGLSKQDGTQAGRAAFKRAVFDYRTEEGFEALKQYRYEWDDDKKCFRDRAVHDWSSHPADAWIYLGIVWQGQGAMSSTSGRGKPDAYGFDDENEISWAVG